MQIIEKEISELKPYKNNPRKIGEDAINYVANSIKEFGFKVPIVIDKDDVVVTGHTRLLASKKLGLKKVPCIVADDLSEKQIDAFRLADNKVNEFSSWDFDKLDSELQIDEFDMTKFGFDFLDKEEEEIKPEVEFSEVIGEENNYIVLQFKNDVDWLQAQTIFNLKSVKCKSTRNDGKITKNMERIGIGRVVDGSKFLNDFFGENKK